MRTSERHRRDRQKELADDLLRGFHTQFAENQRTREQSFIKIIGFLGAVVLGYAYVYRQVRDDEVAFALVALACMLVLGFGAAIVAAIAYSFRRDQFVNARIRRKAGIIGDGKPFPAGYDPIKLFNKRLALFRWMPDIFFFFFWIFPIFEALILISYALRERLEWSMRTPFGTENLTVLASVIVILASIGMQPLFGYKLRTRMNGVNALES